MPNELVVAITLGQHDLQFLAIDTHGKKWRISPVKERVGVIHRALIAKEIPYVVWCPQETAVGIQELRAASVDWDSGQLKVNLTHDKANSTSTNIDRLATPEDVRLKSQEAGENCIVIVPGVLHQHLTVLRSELLSGQYRLGRLLLLDTNRGAKWKLANSEPVAAAPVLKRWLSEIWLADVPGFDPDVIEPVTYLRAVGGEAEPLYVEDYARNRYLNPNAAARIDNAFRKAAAPNSIPRLHDSAGIPEVRPVLHASINLRFSQPPQIRPTDQHPNRERPALYAIDPPAFLLETRRRARDLLRTGQIGAASAIVGQLVSEPSWRQVVEATSWYIRGYRDEAEQLAKSNSEDVAPLLRRLTALQPDLPRCAHIAMRGEAALWAGDIIQAVNQSVTFFDVALLDATNLVLTKKGVSGCVDWNTGRIRLSDTIVGQAGLIDRAEKMLKEKPDDCIALPKQKRDITSWGNNMKKFGNTMTSANWQEAVLIETIRDASRKVGDALHDLFGALQTRQSSAEGSISPAYLRNQFTHVLPSQRQLTEARRVFTNCGLWVPDASEFGDRFAASPTVGPVLKSLGVDPPGKFYQQLIEGLVKSLEQ